MRSLLLVESFDLRLIIVEVEVEVKLRPTVSRLVHLSVRHASGTRDKFVFLLEIFFRQLRVCYFVAPSLTRGRFCNLLLLLVLSARVRVHGIQDHILLSQFLRLPQPGGPGPPGTGWSRYTPGHWVPVPSPLTILRATGEVFYPASTREAIDWLLVYLTTLYQLLWLCSVGRHEAASKSRGLGRLQNDFVNSV
jgi:hypothetical protein